MCLVEPINLLSMNASRREDPSCLWDASSYVHFLSERESVAGGPMGVVVYCFSRALPMRIEAARPDHRNGRGFVGYSGMEAGVL